MKTELIFYGLILGLAPTLSQAQNANENPETIVVSATKNRRPIDTIAASIKVLGKKAIEEKQAIQLIDALNGVPGLSFARNGGYGQNTSVFIRGGESHDTLLIIDGVPMTEPSLPAGNFDFASLALNEVDTIEIVKGPQSVLYGSDAIGGIINIRSRIPQKSIEGSVNLEAGTLNTSLARLYLGGRNSNFTYSLAAHDFKTDGISAKAKSIGGIESDGAKNYGINGAIGYNLNDALELNLRANYINASADFDGFPPPLYTFSDTQEFNKTEQANLYFGIKSSGFDRKLKSEFSIKTGQSKRRNFDPTSVPQVNYIANSQSISYEYLGNLFLTKSLDLVFGAHSNSQDYSARSPAAWDPNPNSARAKSTIDSLYAEFQYNNPKGVFFTFGTRLDNHSVFGENTTLRTSLAFSPVGTNSRFHINYGEGFKAPSLFQIYSDYGNLELRPEIAKALELGFSHKFTPDWKVSIIGFKRQSEDQIDFFSCFGSSAPLCAIRQFGFYDNIKLTEAAGYEFESNFKRAGFSIDANYTYLETLNKTPNAANFGNMLARRPKNSANIDISYSFNPRFSASLNYNFIGARFDDAGNFNRLKNYELFGLRANLKIKENYDLYARIENLFDEEYQNIKNYGAMPRTFNLGIRARF